MLGMTQVATTHPAAPPWVAWKTVAMATACILVTPFGLLTLTGYLLPFGVVFAAASLGLAALVLTRTTPGCWPRRFAWGLLIWSLLPWILTAAYLFTINVWDR